MPPWLYRAAHRAAPCPPQDKALLRGWLAIGPRRGLPTTGRRPVAPRLIHLHHVRRRSARGRIVRSAMNRRFLPILGALALLAFPGCSIKKIAVNSLGNALAGGTSSYAEDDDPDLVREAVPFALKTIEGLLAEAPRHRGLLLAATSGFTQYGYAFMQQEADFVESRDLGAATALRNRSRKHYKRADRLRPAGAGGGLPRNAASGCARTRRRPSPGPQSATSRCSTGPGWPGARPSPSPRRTRS